MSLKNVYISTNSSTFFINGIGYWLPGMPVITKAPSTYQELIERMQNSNEYSCFDWYLCFKNLNSNGRNIGGDINERI